ncbi:MAG TPA: hypothetical protein VEZ89_07900, partial [Rubrivivax sp.]|nr:hypothetical protein [Rubrivivax sp.]
MIAFDAEHKHPPRLDRKIKQTVCLHRDAESMADRYAGNCSHGNRRTRSATQHSTREYAMEILRSIQPTNLWDSSPYLFSQVVREEA